MAELRHPCSPGTSLDVPGLFGRLACLLLPLVAWFCVQPLTGLHLTDGALAGGAWHTLWTGHIMHFGFEHFLWDALMFASFSLLLWREERWRLWAWLLIAPPILSFVVFTVHPALTEYRGLSAVDTMLFARYFLGSFRVLSGWQRWSFAALPLVALVAKIGFEFATGDALFVGGMGPGVVPLPSAHATGALLGLLWFILKSIRRPIRAQTSEKYPVLGRFPKVVWIAPVAGDSARADSDPPLHTVDPHKPPRTQ